MRQQVDDDDHRLPAWRSVGAELEESLNCTVTFHIKPSSSVWTFETDKGLESEVLPIVDSVLEFHGWHPESVDTGRGQIAEWVSTTYLYRA